ncbi:MAG: matrixin family metalloprotease [Nitrosopumilus sp.]
MEIQNDHPSIYFKENIQGINEYPYNWPDGEILCRLNIFTNDIAKERLQHRAVTIALRAWQLRINKVRFRRERNPNPSVDFEVSFEPLENFTDTGILAQAYFPGQGNVSGDCEINDEWNWVTSSKYQTIGNPPLVPVSIHEFGHSLGLRHDTMEKESIMHPSFNLGKRKNSLH